MMGKGVAGTPSPLILCQHSRHNEQVSSLLPPGGKGLESEILDYLIS